MTKSMVLGGIAVLATVAIAASSVGIAQDAISQRKAAMKSFGGNAKVGSDMSKGTVPFDAAKAADAMNIIATGAATLVKLFPEGSDTGETRASPKIWQDRKGFEANATKLASDAAAAQKASAAGVDAFKAAFGIVVKNCDSCHETYRTPRK